MRILIITEGYPFGDGETFLVDELTALAAVFDRVVVAPRGRIGSPNEVPAGIDVLETLAVPLRTPARHRGSFVHHLRSDVLRRPVPIVPWPLRGVAAYLRRRALLRDARRVERWATGLLDTLDAETPTVLYSYWFDSGLLGIAAAVARHPRGSRTAVVCRAHGSDLYNTLAAAGLKKRIGTALARAHLFCVSEAGRCDVLRRYPDLADRIAVARLGVEDPTERSEPSPDGRFRVVSCSALRSVKRVDRIIDALKELARRRPELPITGSHFGDGPLRESLAARASTLPASVSVKWFGQRPRADVLAHFSREPVDVLVNLSDSEGIPVSIMEAFSFGIPALATGVGGTPEIVGEDGGILLPRRPPQHVIVDALEMFVGQDREHAWRVGAHRRFARDYHAETNHTRFAEAIRAIAIASDPRVGIS